MTYINYVLEKEICKKELEINLINVELKEKKILIIHGSGFNWGQPDHFRVVYLPRIEVLKDATVVEFARFEKGEGIEKKEENFAEEVAKQMQGK